MLLTPESGTFRSLVPSGASTGSHEAFELRDTSSPAYGGKGVSTAVGNIMEIIAPALISQRFNVDTDLKKIDAFLCELDGTKGKSRLGANAILGVSMACARAGAAANVSPSQHVIRNNQSDGSKSPSGISYLTRDRKSLSMSSSASKQVRSKNPM